MKNPSPEHQKLVKAAIDYFISEGFSILSADYEGFSEPNKHGRHAPDIVMKDKEGILHILEAKIEGDLSSETTKQQFQDFSNRIMKASSDHPKQPVSFHIIIYRRNASQLVKVLNSLNLDQLINKRIFIHWLNG